MASVLLGVSPGSRKRIPESRADRAIAAEAAPASCWFLDKDYQQAGFPTLTQIFNHAQLSRITFIWIISTAVTGLMIPLFGIVADFWINIGLFLSGDLLTWKAFGLLVESEDFSAFRLNFKYINYFALFVVFLVSIDKLIL